jgi:hypothetical protein
MATQPTPQDISALLHEAGLEGYAVDVYMQPRRVTVAAQPPASLRGVTAQVREHEMLDAFTEVIAGAGFRVSRDQVGFSVMLIISAHEEERV